MGEVPHRLHCAWHVDKSFRDNCRRLIKNNKDKMVQVYKSLRTLMDEQDATTFEALLPTFVQQLHNDCDTAAFAHFFQLHYCTCTDSWAYCYRSNCGINTNMHLERMNGSFKHVYQRGKKNKRLDSAIYALMNLAYEKEFDRLISICKGKYIKKLSELKKRHAASKEQHCINVEMEIGKEWAVRSSSDEHAIYTVRLVNADCMCHIRCSECAVCIHTYSCTCADNQTFFNMCKHIHYICQVRLSYAVPVSEQCNADPDSDSDSGVLTVSNINSAYEQHENEAAAHIRQLSRPVMSIDTETSRS